MLSPNNRLIAARLKSVTTFKNALDSQTSVLGAQNANSGTLRMPGAADMRAANNPSGMNDNYWNHTVMRTKRRVSTARIVSRTKLAYAARTHSRIHIDACWGACQPPLPRGSHKHNDFCHKSTTTTTVGREIHPLKLFFMPGALRCSCAFWARGGV